MADVRSDCCSVYRAVRRARTVAHGLPGRSDRAPDERQPVWLADVRSDCCSVAEAFRLANDDACVLAVSWPVGFARAVTHGQSDCHPDEGESVDHANVGTDDVVTAYERAYKRSKSCSVATAFELSDGHVRGAANRG